MVAPSPTTTFVNNNHNNQNRTMDDPATTSSNNNGGEFPPCTADQCTVNEEDKKSVTSKTRPSCEMTEKCVNACAAYGRVCPCAARIASHAACDAMMELQTDSNVFEPGSKPDFTYFNAEDIEIGAKLGEGGFSNVNLCTIKETTTQQQSEDQPVSEHGDDSNHSANEKPKELAVKYLKRKAMVDLHHFKHGAADLAVEAYFLQTLNHPNIVQLHGITAGSVETNVATGKECGFFILVDRLYDTLEHRIDSWRKAELEQSGGSGGTNFMQRRSAEYKEKKRAELRERCQIALSIAQAMQYLHSLNIIFRDLKPDNCGFDKDGTLKLFDFGLAKELKHPNDQGKYRLTGHTGSRRYMAPEVAQDLHYNQSVDVYSFGILLWELCSAQKPFYGYSSNKHMQLVVLGGERPKMDAAHTQHWPAPLQNLMKRCWHKDADQRPTFEQVISVLENKILSPPQNVLESQISLGLEDAEAAETHMTNATRNNNNGRSLSPPRFLGIFPAKRTGRATSVEPPAEGAFKAMKPNKAAGGGGTRSRSWGFGGGVSRR